MPEPGAGALIAVYTAGWVVAISATFTISHGDLFGLRQAFLHARRAAYRPPPSPGAGCTGSSGTRR